MIIKVFYLVVLSIFFLFLNGGCSNKNDSIENRKMTMEKIKRLKSTIPMLSSSEANTHKLHFIIGRNYDKFTENDDLIIIARYYIKDSVCAIYSDFVKLYQGKFKKSDSFKIMKNYDSPIDLRFYIIKGKEIFFFDNNKSDIFLKKCHTELNLFIIPKYENRSSYNRIILS
ncbi:MAG: hypothetical protein EAY69_02380 [Cytophagales bacterium]|nr:MAG: hypothetical protein EAY69_02380 [Cytophagales bacterium]